VQQYFPFVHRLFVAQYDEPTDILNANTHVTEGENILAHYSAKLSDSSSLQKILDIFSYLIALTIINELATVKTLTSTIDAMHHLASHRDMETGTHINQTSLYA